MQDSIQIRPAQPEDAERAALLLYSAYTHTHVSYPLREKYDNRFIERLQHFFRQGGNRFSYQNIQDEARLNAAVGSWLEREAQDDEWYVDALAVLKHWEHKGIGTRLLQTAEQQARQHHYPKIALHVAQGNQEALALYTHLHYVVTQQTYLYHRPHIRMVKTLENGEQRNNSTGSTHKLP
jgi:ribosomal protein S18 acetylase RimI-like enzyme